MPRASIERTKHWQWNFAAQKKGWKFKRKLSDHKLTSSKSKQRHNDLCLSQRLRIAQFFFRCMVQIEWVFKMHAQVQLYLNFSHCDHYCHGAFQIKLSSYSFSLHLNEICMRFFCVYYFLMRMSIDNDNNVQQITTKYSTKC